MRVKDYSTQASHVRKGGHKLRARSQAYLRRLAARKIRRPTSRRVELPYDDDPAWNASFAKSLDVLQRLAEKTRKDHDEGRAIELDPDQL